MVFVPFFAWANYHKRFSWIGCSYDNIYVSDRFIPIMGDYKDNLDDQNAGRIHYHNRIRDSPILKNYDMKFKLEAFNPVILLVSDKAIKEYDSMVPHKIDRHHNYKGLSLLADNNFFTMRTTSQIAERKKLLISQFSLTKSSQYVSQMLTCSLDVIDRMEENKEYDFFEECHIITFNIFTSVLFGEDIKQLALEKRPYKRPGSKIENLSLRGYMTAIFKDYIALHFHPLAILFPFLASRKLINPFKNYNENREMFSDFMKHLYDNSKDKNSVCMNLLNYKNFSDHEKLNDLICFFFAGAETSSHAIVSALYLLKKNPDKMKKLQEELKNNGISKEFVREKSLTRERLECLEYLSCVVKETFRIDTPAADSFIYTATQDIILCEVPFAKGTLFREDIVSNHFNEDLWKDPHDFVPERFDVESEFYQKSIEEGKKPGPYSRRTFCHGFRGCPGQSFGTLEVKIALLVFLTHIDVEIEEEFLNKEGVGFGIGSKLIPLFKVHQL